LREITFHTSEMEYGHDTIDGRKATPNRARVWTVEEINRLIKVWSNHEVLYNTRHPDYYRREKRSVAMADLQDKLGGINLVDIIRKMENLRSYFGREIKRIHDNETSVSTLQGQSRWAYFDSLLFLEEHMNQKRANTRSDEGVTRFDSSDGDNVEPGLDDESEGAYQVEEEAEQRHAKRQKLSERSKLDANLLKLSASRFLQTGHVNRSSSGLVAPVKATIRDSFDSYSLARDQTRMLPSDSSFTDKHEDMVFAEHVGRTIMSITDELLKEDLKLQIQQCLCATKRKQIAIHQQQNAVHSRSSSNCNSAEARRRSEKSDTHPPSFVSFVSMESPGSPIHPEATQLDSEEQSRC